MLLVKCEMLYSVTRIRNHVMQLHTVNRSLFSHCPVAQSRLFTKATASTKPAFHLNLVFLFFCFWLFLFFLPVFLPLPQLKLLVVLPTTCFWFKTLRLSYTSLFNSSYSIWTVRLGCCSSLSKILFFIKPLEPIYCNFLELCHFGCNTLTLEVMYLPTK